eukprot:Lithocolla_globosa_v1_NODE_423_length_4101_cov_40.764459.p1 type:complete len:357 gc:universal NODE_423_length_4101_cov_40.764459:2466-3536(+)
MKSLIAFLGTILISAGARQESYDRTHSLHIPFIDADLNNRFFDFGGSTVVSTNKHVRLTPDRQSKRGNLWSKKPLDFNDWSIEFEFQVHGQGSKVYGDGFAFWYTKERAELGPVFGNMDEFTGLGIFFDTYQNVKHPDYGFPYVSAMIGDGNTPYSHDDDNERNQLAGCEASFRGGEHVMKAKLRYVGSQLELLLDVDKEGEYQQCFLLDDVQLPRGYYVGFSAMTGDVADVHDITKVTTFKVNRKGKKEEKKPKTPAPAVVEEEEDESVIQSGNNKRKTPQQQKQQQQQEEEEEEEDEQPVTRAPKKNKKKRSGGSPDQVWTVLKWLFGSIALVVVVIVGVVAFRTLTNDRNKRF